jgi:hypothetical protein
LLVVGKSAGGVLGWLTFYRHYNEIAGFNRAALATIDPHGSAQDGVPFRQYNKNDDLWWPGGWPSDTDVFRVYNIYQYEQGLTGASFPDPRVYENVRLSGDVSHSNILEKGRTHELIREAISFAWLGGVEYVASP